MPRSRRLLATLLLVAIASCSEPFQAAVGDAQSIPKESGTDFDAAMDPGEGGMPPADAPVRLVPPVAKDLLLWLRADVGVTQTLGKVSRWADQSGHGSDAVQTDPTKQPSQGVSDGSVRAAVVFDNEDFLSLPAGFSDFSRGISMFVALYTDTTGRCFDALDFSNGPEIDDITIGRHDDHVHYEVSSFAIPGDDFPVGAARLASVVHAPDQTVQLRLNSAPFTTANAELPATVTRLSNVVGRSLYADCGSVDGGLWEALVYNRALDNDERLLVESYLQTRWDCCR